MNRSIFQDYVISLFYILIFMVNIIYLGTVKPIPEFSSHLFSSSQRTLEQLSFFIIVSNIIRILFLTLENVHKQNRYLKVVQSKKDKSIWTKNPLGVLSFKGIAEFSHRFEDKYTEKLSEAFNITTACIEIISFSLYAISSLVAIIVIFTELSSIHTFGKISYFNYIYFISALFFVFIFGFLFVFRPVKYFFYALFISIDVMCEPLKKLVKSINAKQ